MILNSLLKLYSTSLTSVPDGWLISRHGTQILLPWWKTLVLYCSPSGFITSPVVLEENHHFQ